MDISINQIDLKYLTDYSLDNHLNPSKQNDKYQKDLEFYKKRIFKLTKDLLRGHTVDSDINACFQNYTQKCIDYFEFIDKRDIIQEDYKDLKQKKPQSMRTFDLTNINVEQPLKSEYVKSFIKEYQIVFCRTKIKNMPDFSEIKDAQQFLIKMYDHLFGGDMVIKKKSTKKGK